MIMTTQYKVLPELKIIIEYFSGATVLVDMIEHRKKLIEDNEYNSNFNFITDFRDAILIFSEEDVISYIDFARNTVNILGKRRAAILADTPNQSLVSNLYVLNIKDLPFLVEIFSTLDAALKWVRVSKDDKKIIEDTIKKMKDYRHTF